MKIKIISAIALSVALAACTTNLSQLRSTKPAGTNFSRSLSAEYLAYSEWRAGQYDWQDSEYFAGKGLAAAKGQGVAPETFEKRKIPANMAKDMTMNRDRLVRAIANTGKESRAMECAKAQVAFDCLTDVLSEPTFVNSDVKRCSDILNTNLKICEGAQDAYSIHFKTGSAALDKAAVESIRRVAAELKGLKGYSVKLVGHTDTKGSKKANDKLASKRVNAVRAGLIKNGISKKSISVASYGESHNAVPTKDGISESANRRVEIIIGQ